MAAVSFQLTSILQETLTAQPPTTTTTPTNTDQVQATPATQDTVTLTGQTAQQQQTAQNPPQQGQFQETVFVVSEAQIFPAPAGQAPAQNAAAAPPNGNVTDPPAAENPELPQENIASVANTGGAASTAAGTPTPQQQLLQLDQTLQQLGIDPNSISLFNRLALVLYANDPAALAAFVQQLQGIEQNGQQNTGSGTSAQTQTSAQNAALALLPNQSQGGTPAPQASGAQTLNQTQNQTPVAPAIVPLEVLAAQFTFTDAQAAASTAPAQNQTVPANQPSAANVSQPSTGNTVFVQYAELQLAFAAPAGQGQTSANSDNAAATQRGQALNVTF